MATLKPTRQYAQLARRLKVPKSLRGKPGELMKAAKAKLKGYEAKKRPDRHN